MVVSGKTDVGRVRDNNEDSIFVCNEKIGFLPNLFIVADGMGGHKAGEVASSSSITFFIEFVHQQYINLGYSEEFDFLDFLVDAVSYANKKVFQNAHEDIDLYGMGTTFSVCSIKDNKVYIAHLGDSRIYLISDDKIKQLTYDHTYVNEMVKAGQITQEEARVHPKKNLITKAMGIDNNIPIDGFVTELNSNDKLLLCSDGLTTMLTDQMIFEIANEENDTEIKVDRLIESANFQGGFDNVSVVLIENVRC